METNEAVTAQSALPTKPTKSKASLVKRIINIIVTVIVYTFFVCCIFCLVVAIVSKTSSDGAVNVFGKQMRIVVSSSMEKSDYTDVSEYEIKDIPVKSMVFIDLVPEDEEKKEEFYASLKVGDVLTFQYYIAGAKIITHRIISITPETKGYKIELQGDNKSDETVTGVQTIHTYTGDQVTSETFNFVIGKVTGQSYGLGVIIYALKQPLGMALLVIVPCGIIIIYEVIKIITVLSESRREKLAKAHAEEQTQQQSEIEELKKQLAALQQQSQQQTNPAVQPQALQAEALPSESGVQAQMEAPLENNLPIKEE
jgi:hypothetical protein